MSIITPGILNNNQITTASIDDDAVTTSKILNNAVTNAKLANDSITLNSTVVALGGSLTLGTDDIDEGSTNLYYTDGRVQSVIDTNTAGFITTYDPTEADITEHEAALTITESQISDLTHYTDTQAVDAVEAETALALQEGVTVDDDITIGDHNLRGQSNLTATGLHIVSPEDKVKWAAVQLEEYGGDFADADEKPYNISNPGMFGMVHGGSVASPTATPGNKRLMNISGNARYGTGSGDTDTIAQMLFITSEDQTSTDRGGHITWQVNPLGTTDLKDTLKLSATGTTQLDLAYDPNGSFDKTYISTQSTNGFDITTQVIVLSNLPTADPVNNGQLWNDNGTLKISAG